MTAGFQIDVHLPPDFAARALEEDVRRGLSATPKSLPPKWFYDKVGSDLFEAITQLPEYYPTRAEAEILQREAGAIADASSADTLVELGSGSSTKTRLILDALQARGTLHHYVALDVSAAAIEGAASTLVDDYPGLSVLGLVADFDHHLDLIPRDGSRLVAFLGGTIGNFEPEPRQRFLRAICEQLGPDDTFLLGTDLVKSPSVLVPAYDDSQGVTATFNRNVLSVINRQLDADFVVDAFEHVALWDADDEWIEMRLRASRAMTVHVRALGMTVEFADGEELRTEISAKFRREQLGVDMARAGFREQSWWTDGEDRFALSLWRPDAG